MVGYFGAEKRLRDINQGDTDSWRLWLLTDQHLADNTVRRRCGIAKQFFDVALKRRLIQQNPFFGLASTVRQNTKRNYFVTNEDGQRVLDACPDAEWRLIFALSRYGGLRCPSEHLRLRWEDVDWAGGRFVVHSSKTEHHPDGLCRTVPLFPELLPQLREVFEAAEPGGEFVITRYRNPSQNLRTHYLQVTEEHYERALRNPVQSAHAKGRTGSHDETTDFGTLIACNNLRVDASEREECVLAGMGDNGLEPLTSSL